MRAESRRLVSIGTSLFESRLSGYRFGMSDAQLPPPDPDEIERDDETTPSENSASGNSSDGPAVAGEGPALLTPPVPSDSGDTGFDPDAPGNFVDDRESRDVPEPNEPA
jgi:hypothetical protein